MNWGEIDPAVWAALGAVAAFLAKDLWPWLRARLDSGYAQRVQEQKEQRAADDAERRELVTVLKNLDTVHDNTLRTLTAYDFRIAAIERLQQQQQVTNERIATALEILAENVAGNRRERRPRSTVSQAER
jgi:hypothetical protein